MIYYALPKLEMVTGGIEGIFFISWFLLAFLVIAGNLSALYLGSKQRKMAHRNSRKLPSKKHIRSFHR
jgi:hypothetical protein